MFIFNSMQVYFSTLINLVQKLLTEPFI